MVTCTAFDILLSFDVTAQPSNEFDGWHEIPVEAGYAWARFSAFCASISGCEFILLRGIQGSGSGSCGDGMGG
jgi:hypothetical protein